MRKPVRLGISLTSRHDVTDVRLGARWMIERAAAARRSGLDSLFVGDHHATAAPYYQNVPILGRLLAQWGSAPAGCFFLLPLWNPVLVAEQVGTLGAIAEGRFILQCGLGGGEAQFAAMGANVRHRPSAFEEALDIVKRLLAGETVTSSSRFGIRAARVALRPPERVEYWIGASARPAIDRAARLGDGWLASPRLPPDEAREQAVYYQERCAAHGRPPGAVAIRRDLYVGESRADARAVAEHAVATDYRDFAPEALVCGSAADVTDQLQALSAMGYTDVIVRHLIDDQPRVLGSLSRLGLVREALQHAAGARSSEIQDGAA